MTSLRFSSYRLARKDHLINDAVYAHCDNFSFLAQNVVIVASIASHPAAAAVVGSRSFLAHKKVKASDTKISLETCLVPGTRNDSDKVTNSTFLGREPHGLLHLIKSHGKR